MFDIMKCTGEYDELNRRIIIRNQECEVVQVIQKPYPEASQDEILNLILDLAMNRSLWLALQGEPPIEPLDVQPDRVRDVMKMLAEQVERKIREENRGA